MTSNEYEYARQMALKHHTQPARTCFGSDDKAALQPYSDSAFAALAALYQRGNQTQNREAALGESPEQQQERFLREAPSMMNMLPRCATWGFEVKWTSFGGRSQSCSVDHCPTIGEAISQAFDLATRMGWTPPKWWQWWRRGDTQDLRD